MGRAKKLVRSTNVKTKLSTQTFTLAEVSKNCVLPSWKKSPLRKCCRGPDIMKTSANPSFLLRDGHPVHTGWLQPFTSSVRTKYATGTHDANRHMRFMQKDTSAPAAREPLRPCEKAGISSLMGARSKETCLYSFCGSRPFTNLLSSSQDSRHRHIAARRHMLPTST